ncbi:MAG: hypothetical protein K9G40_00225 [Crocinitomicaceae bacterium]|jgi:hypothetical protein|nr:hypothetical protein [Crocinitomicaceae bacterium]MCF8433209.1 hypothetical protein [Crocinitomicaceae bacterium]
MINKTNQYAELAMANFLNKIQVPASWNTEAWNEIITHFQQYSIENKELITPKKGLFIVAKLEDEAILFTHLIMFYLAELYKQLEENSSYDKVPKEYQIRPYTFSSTELFFELIHSRKIDEIFQKISAQRILCITDFGEEGIAKLEYHNKIDFIPELIKKRHRNLRYRNANSPLYIINKCSKELLKKRYSEETFFYLKALTDEIFLSDV